MENRSADPAPVPHGHEDHPDIIGRNSRYGLMLFGVYVLLYGGFMALNAFWPEMMKKTPFGGVNLAVIYGMALIIAALLLALVYMALCRPVTLEEPKAGRGGK